MQTQRSRSIEIPDGLSSSRGKLIYLYLKINGSATIDELKADLGIQLLTLYGVLKRLRQSNHVRKTENRWTLTDSSAAK